MLRSELVGGHWRLKENRWCSTPPGPSPRQRKGTIAHFPVKNRVSKPHIFLSFDAIHCYLVSRKGHMVSYVPS